jgi:hypothetical protein
MRNQNNRNPNENKEEQTRKRVKRVVTIILIAVIIIIILLLLRSCGSGSVENITPTQPTIGTDLPIDPDAGEYVPPETKAPSQGVAIPGWGTIVIPANKSENIVVDFYNPELNDGLYYLTFELRIADDSEQGYEVIYKSGLVEPGKHIQKISLTRGLEPGTYDAFIYVQPYRMDEYKTPTNNANLKTELIVK